MMDGDDVKLIAHIRKSDAKEQSAVAHCKSTASLAKSAAASVGLENAARLCGLLHDMGKFTHRFSAYIKGEIRDGKPVNHSPAGAIYAYENWYKGDNAHKIAAQIISLVIRGHHGGLPDCVNTDMESPYLTCIGQPHDPLCYDESVENFHQLCATSDDLDLLFEKACHEINEKCRPEKEDYKYRGGMIARFLLSCVVDADRWDSMCFENSINPEESESVRTTDWSQLSKCLESEISGFSRDSLINTLRADVSEQCLQASGLARGIYTLAVPTGGGKTLSGLRFAVNHLDKKEMKRLFFVIPYNTILEQNSAEIRKFLGGYDDILEHYGNFFCDSDGESDEHTEEEHLKLTERWVSGIILTSVVQFMNSVYKGGNSNARRFCRLADSVIVFDEIQALPKKCTVMFEKAIAFLSEQLGCTVLLCTATQPELYVHAKPLISDVYVSRMKKELCRVNIRNYATEPTDICTYETAADRLVERVAEYGSVLMIVNTKKAAAEIFRLVSPKLPDDCLKIHLSTLMAPAHRTDKIVEMKLRLLEGKPVVCISTALIEAGVDISFPCVIRSLAGLPSIVQSAGRCNRHMELGAGEGNVEVWYLCKEDVSRLDEIKTGQDITTEIICRYRHLSDSDEEILAYFTSERQRNRGIVGYPYKNYSLSKMISDNEKLGRRCSALESAPGALSLLQAFSEVGRNFEVIDEDTVSVVVPYGKANELITEMNGELSLRAKIRKMREAQSLAVSVYRDSFNRMLQKGILFPIGETGMFALKDEYYDPDVGVVFEGKSMELLSF